VKVFVEIDVINNAELLTRGKAAFHQRIICETAFVAT
jgi:hypothetical protein